MTYLTTWLKLTNIKLKNTMKLNTLIRFLAIAMASIVFMVSAQALTFSAWHNTGNDHQAAHGLDYGYMMDDTVDPPATSYSFQQTGSTYTLNLWYDTHLLGTHSVGFLSSDGILDEEEVFVYIH